MPPNALINKALGVVSKRLKPPKVTVVPGRGATPRRD
jgi:hypothetical protein